MDSLFNFLKRFEKYTKNMDLLIAFSLIGVLAVMIIPLSSFVLDLALTLSLTISLLVLLIAIYTNKPLEFSVFPSLLLLTTLFRLSLNVASTRRILTEGHNGTSAAGEVIAAFGNFVVGNNYVIGLIVFIILVIINFVVITKGSGRVAEVAARFTLDAMPGKQMSIDADLNAGLISEADARTRRREIEQEADFYGSMDGASKFVRGDAIAGILITVINIIGGLLVGVLQKGLSFSQAAEFYTMLTIGDGLVSQIPALVISTAAGMVVTRSTSEQNMGQDIANQLLLNPRALMIVASIIGFLGLIPGLPKTPFFSVAFLVGSVGWLVWMRQKEVIEEKKKADIEEAHSSKDESIETLLPLDLVEVEIGYSLINVVESDSSGDLLERIVSIRKQFALDMGIIIPGIHLRDNLQLEPGEYRFVIKGNKVASGMLRPDQLMAMDPGNTTAQIDGTPTKEPAFGLDALWISESQRDEAEMAGYTVVDPSTIMATHLTEVLRSHCHELLGREEVNALVENYKKQYPKVIEELIPEKLSLGAVVKVLQNLLKEQISIRDLLTIFETLADESSIIKDPDQLTELVRRSLSRSITVKYLDDDSSLPVLTLSPSLEEQITNSLLQTEHGIQLVLDPQIAQEMINGIAGLIESNPEIAAQPILLTSPTVRRHVFKLTSRFLPQLIVLSHTEVSSSATVKSIGTVEVAHGG